MNTKSSLCMLITLLLLVACSIEVSQPQGEGAAPAPGSSTAAPDSAAATPESSALSPDDLDLSGYLYYVSLTEQRPKLVRLDLASDQETVIFEPPENAWLNEIAVSPDGGQIAMTYAPPPEEGQIQFGFTDIYLMPAGGTQEPSLLLQRIEDSETFFNLSWPAEAWLYYAHFIPSEDDVGAGVLGSQIKRLPYPDGRPELLADEAAWPRVSPDGARMAYVTERNELVVAQADGQNPMLILRPDTFFAVDAPLFSPDGSQLYFSAVNPEQASLLSFWDRLWGVQIAAAHDVPSDWWRMPADGSAAPERLTNLNAIGLYGDFSPDGRHMAFIASEGIYVMKPDGSDLLQLRSATPIGTISWVP
jgi:Tol biopolymer transport system component